MFAWFPGDHRELQFKGNKTMRRRMIPNVRPLFACFGMLLSLVLLPASGVTRAGDDWPQFRGPNCTGIASSAAHLPTRFSATENVAWSCSVGDGIGGAVIASGRLFVSGMTDKEVVTLSCFDAKTGKPLWSRNWPTGTLSEVHETNSHASTTPAADDRHVYFYFSTLGLMALDAKTGEDVWKKELPQPYFVFKWGPAISPVLYKDLVLFCQDDDLNPKFYAFEKSTGNLRWSDDRGDMAVNYTHPVICSTDGVDEIVLAGTGMLIGYDPQTGKRKWFARCLLRNIKTTPVVLDGVIHISLQSGGIAFQWLASVDQVETGNKDGKLTREEVQAFVGATKIPEAFFEKTFGRGDINKDGMLEGRELDLAFMSAENFAGARFDAEDAADEYVLAVKGGGTGDVTKTHLLWKHETKHTNHIVSPFVRDGRMFLVTDGGISTVFRTEDGSEYRQPKRVGAGASYFASPVLGDGKIYLAAYDGTVQVLENGPEFQQLANNNLEESIVATPAIWSDSLYIRTRTKLFCIRDLKPAP